MESEEDHDHDGTPDVHDRTDDSHFAVHVGPYQDDNGIIHNVPLAIPFGGAASKGVSSNSARLEVIRQQGIPTSQQPVTQSMNMSGRSYEYEVPKAGGGTQIKSVQQQTMDQSHPGQGHWEAGRVKIDPISGQVRSSQYGRPKLTNDKSKMNYDE